MQIDFCAPGPSSHNAVAGPSSATYDDGEEDDEDEDESEEEEHSRASKSKKVRELHPCMFPSNPQSG